MSSENVFLEKKYDILFITSNITSYVFKVARIIFITLYISYDSKIM